MPHRKPRWFPVAPSKMFRLPPQDHIPQSEVDMLLELHYKYRERMAALTQYLWEDYLRNSGDLNRLRGSFVSPNRFMITFKLFLQKAFLSQT